MFNHYHSIKSLDIFWKPNNNVQGTKKMLAGNVFCEIMNQLCKILNLET